MRCGRVAWLVRALTLTRIEPTEYQPLAKHLRVHSEHLKHWLNAYGPQMRICEKAGLIVMNTAAIDQSVHFLRRFMLDSSP